MSLYDGKVSQAVAAIGFAARSNRGISLLEAIDATGSINRAAKTLGISYKAAWEQVEMLNNIAETALLSRSVGGRGGGGTQLTAAGKDLVRHYRVVEREYLKFLQYVHEDSTDAAQMSRLLKRMEMKVSARNVWSGQVTRIGRGVVNVVVEIALRGGDRIIALVTAESCERLGLAVGGSVMAMVKSSAVLLATGVSDQQVSAQNILRGQVARVVDGPVSSNVTIDLPGGNTVCATVTKESVAKLALDVGSDACALIKSSSVMLAVV